VNSRVSILGFVAAVAGLVGLIARRELFDLNPVTIALQALAFLFMVWARITFGMRSFHAAADATEGELVTRGPYGIVRNPIYAAVILFAWAGVGAHLGPASVALGLLILAGMLVRIFAEERALRTHYKDAYAAYCRRVKRLVPLVF
jgi:protein-S-isoprenylcysteine O-methyltransferase Ste14